MTNENNGFKSSIDIPAPCNIEAVNNPLSIKPHSNNYTSLPSDCTSWNVYEDWITYENSEFRADKNFEECWGDIDNLKKQFGEVYLINMNYGERIRKEEGADRHCFGFDYAIAGATPIQKREIKKLADNYRNIPSKDWNCERAIKLITPLIMKIQTFPYIEGHFS